MFFQVGFIIHWLQLHILVLSHLWSPQKVQATQILTATEISWHISEFVWDRRGIIEPQHTASLPTHITRVGPSLLTIITNTILCICMWKESGTHPKPETNHTVKRGVDTSCAQFLLPVVGCWFLALWGVGVKGFFFCVCVCVSLLWKC